MFHPLSLNSGSYRYPMWCFNTVLELGAFDYRCDSFVPVCAAAPMSRLCPGSPRCLFTGMKRREKIVTDEPFGAKASVLVHEEAADLLGLIQLCP